jgi:signal transduction histidine kinase
MFLMRPHLLYLHMRGYCVWFERLVDYFFSDVAMTQKSASGDPPFALTRFLSWISLILIFVSIMLLALFIGQTARETLLSRQQRYSQFIVESLNQQIYRRFTIPTLLAFGRIELQQPKQFERLNEVIQSSILGQPVESLRVFDLDKVVAYSLDTPEVGKTDMYTDYVSFVLEQGRPSYNIISVMTHARAFFFYELPPKSFLLRTVFPLRIDTSFNIFPEPADVEPDGDSPVLGVIELTQDITQDYHTVIRFQWLILLTCLGTCLVLFSILQFFIFKAERIILERMEKMRKLEADLHQHEKLASMGRVIASIAHEIRNPLGIISSSAEFLIKRTPADDTSSRQILKAMFDETCRLSKTVNDFLDFSRPRDLVYGNVNVKALFDQAIGFMENEISKSNVRIGNQIPPSLQVEGDKDLLYRAVYNVLSNALQAMDGSGKLRIWSELDHNTIEVHVLDSGPGFSSDALQRSMDPFFTTKDYGTGLGLPIVNTIITSHGGQVRLTNAPDGGAMVSFTLPRTVNV